MKKYFYLGIAGITLFEVFNVYFIMPMPGSQEMDSLQVAYFLYKARLFFRIFFLVLMIIGFKDAFSIRHKWIPVLACLPAIFIAYVFNFKMTADQMFLQPASLAFKDKAENKLNDSTVVIAVEQHGQAKGYPVRYLVYHHQVRDTLAGKNIMVTYCSVCRTGRVFDPTVDGRNETFRLVGMDHFNAMFEDASTKSWWRQATGEAVTGSRKGTSLPEIESSQLTVAKFFSLYPFGKIMQAEAVSTPNYDSLGRYEKGRSRGSLTRTNAESWKEKSWVAGIQIGKASKAFDWNKLKHDQVINDQVGDQPIVLVLSSDSQSFAAFERGSAQQFTVRHDTLFSGNMPYDFSGKELKEPFQRLKKINVYQEFWHSWRTFHPNTQQAL